MKKVKIAKVAVSDEEINLLDDDSDDSTTIAELAASLNGERNKTPTVLDGVSENDAEGDDDVASTSNNVGKCKKRDESGVYALLQCPSAADRYAKLSDTAVKLYDDETSHLKTAVLHSRLPFEEMTLDEATCFPDVKRMSRAIQLKFINIRNNILKIWVKNPKEQLLLESVQVKLQKVDNFDQNMVRRVHSFLERRGFINFGIFKRVKTLYAENKFRVIVIGAGMAGLAAAQQLKHFGLDVVVLEGRDRVGGRMITFRQTNYMIDLGAATVKGVIGNPLSILCQQADEELLNIRPDCALYGVNGMPVPQEKDAQVELEFHRLMELAKKQRPKSPISLGEAIELVMELEEKKANVNYKVYLKTLSDLKKSIAEHQKRESDLKDKLGNLIGDCVHLRENNRNIEKDKIKLRRMMKERTDLFNKCAVLEKEIHALQTQLSELEKNPVRPVYLTPDERQILDWHLANWEYATNVLLDRATLEYTKNDEDYNFMGMHSTVRNGYCSLAMPLTEGIDLRLHTAVRTIKCLPSGVELAVENMKTPGLKGTFKADVVICTLPLGVLQVATDDYYTDDMKLVKFDPPLPTWKREAIKRLGVSVSNKVVIKFDRIFWDPLKQVFGHVSGEALTRGECFLFWTTHNTSWLVALVTGRSALAMEKVKDKMLVKRCVDVLKQIFGEDAVPEPKESYVTRWLSDPWARGAGSFVRLGSSAIDYDLLAAPVTPSSTNCYHSNENELPRLFFAGEHTIRHYRATVHGAFLSGLREAGRVADYFLEAPAGTPADIGYSAHEAAKNASVGEDVVFVDFEGIAESMILTPVEDSNK